MMISRPIGEAAVIMPSKDCGETTLALAQQISALGMTLFVVDDGSTVPVDVGSLTRVHVIRHNSSRGVGAATTSGIRAAAALGYESFATIDGDGQYRAQDLLTVVAGLGHAEFVLTDRFTGRAEATPTSKLASNYVGACLFNLAFGTRFRDIASGLRAFRKSVIPVDMQSGYGGVFDLLVSAVASGQRLALRAVSFHHPIEQVWTTRHSEILGLMGAFHAVADRLPAKTLAQLSYARKQLDLRCSFVMDVDGTAAQFHALDGGSHYLVQIAPMSLHRYYAGPAR